MSSEQAGPEGKEVTTSSGQYIDHKARAPADRSGRPDCPGALHRLVGKWEEGPIAP